MQAVPAPWGDEDVQDDQVHDDLGGRKKEMAMVTVIVGGYCCNNWLYWLTSVVAIHVLFITIIG